jgi:hypothetical protein
MSFHVDDWKWNIWEMDAKTGKRKKWLGSITDPKTGFAWLKKQGKDAARFRINNVPPPTSTMQMPSREVYAEQDLQVKVGDPLAPRVIPGKYDDHQPRRSKAKVPTVMVSPEPRQGKGTAVRRAVPKVIQAPKTEAEKKLAKDAAALLEQHKADEQAEMQEKKDQG